ncbi:11119_t:CDS:10 [Funneliformis geosporum]|nr:11119_t:CDS:10 [Funneliformis geosporum]
MSSNKVHDYFKRKSEEWSLIGFLTESEEESFRLKIDLYLRGLKNIINHEEGNRKEKAQFLFNKYYSKESKYIFLLEPSHKPMLGHRKPISLPDASSQLAFPALDSLGAGNQLACLTFGWDWKSDEPQSDRELARNWENEQVRQVHFHQQTFLGHGSIHGSSIHGSIHGTVNGTITEPQGHKNDCPEEDLEENLLQETPEAVFDRKLIINNICIRSAIEKWRESSKYVEEIHKQDLMRYNIIDTTSSSATEARKLFKEHWDNVISTIERFLTSNTEQDTYQDTEHDGKAKEVEQYLTKISKNVNNAKKLREVVKRERAKLRTNDNIKWKRRALELMKIFRDQFPNGRNHLKDDQTEYNYIVKFVSRIYTMLFKDKSFLDCNWGEKTLRCSAILLNQSLKDDDRRCSGNKIDAIISILELDLEFSTLEVSGSPSCLDHTHYVGDRNKTAKMLKIILNFIKTNYQGDFEKFRRIKVFGVQMYDHNFYVYSMCMPFSGVYYFKQESKFSYPTITFLVFKDLPIFASNLWIMRNMIISSTENILAYVTSAPTEFGNDDTVIDKVKISPKKKKNK